MYLTDIIGRLTRKDNPFCRPSIAGNKNMADCIVNHQERFVSVPIW